MTEKNDPCSDSTKFDDNEKILCYQTNLLYDAKVLKAEVKEDGKLMYLVHYAGWNKNHDEWVETKRCLKCTEANLQKKEEMWKKFNKDRSKKIKLGNGIKPKIDKTQIKNASSEGRTSPIFRKEPNEKQQEEPVALVGNATVSEVSPEKKVSSKPQPQHQKTQQKIPQELEESMPLFLPHKLKSAMADDYVLINEDKMLSELPAKRTVSDIISKYLNEQETDPEVHREKTREFGGMIESFNVALGSKLLYQFERCQYGDMIDLYPDRAPCEVYGLSHLIRYLSQIEATMTKFNINHSNRKEVRLLCQPLIDYIADNLSELFNANDYGFAPAEYCRRTMV